MLSDYSQYKEINKHKKCHPIISAMISTVDHSVVNVVFTRDTSEDTSYTMSQPKAKVKKEKPEKRVRKKSSNKIRDMDLSSSMADADDEDDESKTNVSVDVTEDDASTVNEFPTQ